MESNHITVHLPWQLFILIFIIRVMPPACSRCKHTGVRARNKTTMKEEHFCSSLWVAKITQIKMRIKRATNGETTRSTARCDFGLRIPTRYTRHSDVSFLNYITKNAYKFSASIYADMFVGSEALHIIPIPHLECASVEDWLCGAAIKLHVNNWQGGGDSDSDSIVSIDANRYPFAAQI